MVAFLFFIGEKEGKKIILRWTFWKGPILITGPSEEFLVVDHPKEDHNEKEFKRYIIGRILDLQKKSCKVRKASM